MFMDRELFKRLIEEYGEDKMKPCHRNHAGGIADPAPPCSVGRLGALPDRIHRRHSGSICASFFFGCEADDRMVAWAFNAKVNPMEPGSAP